MHCALLQLGGLSFAERVQTVKFILHPDLCAPPKTNTTYTVFKDPSCNFPYRMGGLQATTKWVLIGHFVVRPPCKKVQGPLQLWQTMAL